jgi:5-methylcytosine-specific restriction endonuclease McrA
MKKMTPYQRSILDKHKGIVALYKSGKFTSEQIAINYNITPKTVQRVAKKYGAIRTLAESNKLMAKHKNYKHIPTEYKVRRKHLTNKLRYSIINKQPYCTNCGMKPSEGVRLEVDHINNNSADNNLSNLQVLCQLCNTGKSHLDRFGT